MDSEEGIKTDIVRLVTAPPRVLAEHEKPPRPYETGWVNRQFEHQKRIDEPCTSASWKTV
jgi:hypothetical protein